MKRVARLVLIALTVLAFTGWSLPGWAQNAVVPVPNLIGLNPPQAAAALHRVGLRLGDQKEVIRTVSASSSGQITSQTPMTGTTVAAGTAINVEVQLQETLLLVYDNNDMTLVNRAGRNIRLNLLRMVAEGSAQTAQFAIAPDWQTINANSWGRFRGRLEAGQCVQIWSEPAREFKEIDQCGRPNHAAWMSTILPQYHFWTGGNGATTFTVSYNGVVYATCPVARGEQMRLCALAIPFGVANPIQTEYVYLTYSTRRLLIENPSADRWMRLDGLRVSDGIPLAEASAYTRLPFIDDVTRLAPGECLMITNAEVTDQDAPACFVIAERSLARDETAFWRQPFRIGTVARACPPAQNGRDVICMLTY